ncbi:unnamed protein product [Orchesella dallaii]|uniref:Uncharacterized protein n=1 Tax=Orchesella dallaii TaxID=48710 RepID=A0ABP1PU03_9HEXA
MGKYARSLCTEVKLADMLKQILPERVFAETMLNPARRNEYICSSLFFQRKWCHKGPASTKAHQMSWKDNTAYGSPLFRQIDSYKGCKISIANETEIMRFARSKCRSAMLGQDLDLQNANDKIYFVLNDAARNTHKCDVLFYRKKHCYD